MNQIAMDVLVAAVFLGIAVTFVAPPKWVTSVANVAIVLAALAATIFVWTLE